MPASGAARPARDVAGLSSCWVIIFSHGKLLNRLVLVLGVSLRRRGTVVRKFGFKVIAPNKLRPSTRRRIWRDAPPRCAVFPRILKSNANPLLACLRVARRESLHIPMTNLLCYPAITVSTRRRGARRGRRFDVLHTKSSQNTEEGDAFAATLHF